MRFARAFLAQRPVTEGTPSRSAVFPASERAHTRTSWCALALAVASFGTFAPACSEAHQGGAANPVDASFSDVLSPLDAANVADAVAAEAPLAELARVCQQAGGAFDNGECTCPVRDAADGVGKPARLNFDARGGGRCVRTERLADACMDRGGFAKVLETEGLGAFQTCVSSAVVYAFQRAYVRLRTADTLSLDEARTLAAWLDTHLDPSSALYAKVSAPPGTVDVLYVLVGGASLTESEIALSVGLPDIDPGDPNFAAKTVHYLHVPSVAHLDSALGNTSPATQPSAPPRVTEPPADAREVGRRLERALVQTQLDTSGALELSTALERCLGLCDVTQDYQLGPDAEGVETSAFRVRRYQSGVVYRETVAVGSADRKRIDAFAILDLGGQPSILFRIDYSASRLAPRIFAYDRDWRPLGSAAQSFLPDVADALQAVAASRPFAPTDVGVVLCDSGYTFDDQRLRSALVTGPNTVAPAGGPGSLLGWSYAGPHDAQGYLDGVRTVPLGLAALELFPSIHGAGIARVLLETNAEGLRIVPRGADRCLHDPNALAAVRNDALIGMRTRVVNLSATESLDAEACRARFPTGLDPHFLWVTAAGNSGRRFTADEPLARCPQTLPRRDNLLVVAAREGNSIWPFSDFGVSYADLVADCFAEAQGQCSGTSNAAPRVARTAAAIVGEHGGAVSNAMVRMAILLGVTVPTRTLPLRSGGIHHHDDALRAARELVSSGMGLRDALTVDEARSVLTAVYRDTAYANRKLSILEQNGVFSSR